MARVKMSSQWLRKVIVEAIITLVARTPLYSIRLQDVSDFINSRYQQSYLSGSIECALEKMVRTLMEGKDKAYAQQVEDLAARQLRTEAKNSPRLGRNRRVIMYLYLLARDFVWTQLTPMTSVFCFNLPPVVKLRLVADAFLGFRVDSSFSEEMLTGMKQIFFVEGTIPIGMPMGGAEIQERWSEPLSDHWIIFSQNLGSLIMELQAQKIFTDSLPAALIGQTMIGSIMGLAYGRILASRNENFRADYSHEEALLIVRQSLRGFCLTKKSLEVFDHDWPEEK